MARTTTPKQTTKAPRRGPTKLDILVMIFTITGLNLKYIIETIWPEIKVPIAMIVLISISFSILIPIYFISKGKRGYKTTHVFEEGSIEESQFFTEWYLRRGRLIIFCTDLEWLEHEQDLEVIDALKRKGNNLELYLRKPDHRIVSELRLAGAEIHTIKPSIRSEHRFSILLTNGFRSIILRDKRIDPYRIQIDEYPNNPALVNLALDMLDDSVIEKNKTA